VRDFLFCYYLKILIYNIRQSIKETPCWIEIQIHRALQLLDDLFNTMNHQLSSSSISSNNSSSSNLTTTTIESTSTRPPQHG
jgi:hypothetical protein